MIKVITRPKIKVKPIEIDYNKNTSQDALDFNTENLGRFPLLVFNGLTLDNNYVEYFKISNDKFLPYFEMIFSDPSNKLKEDIYPLDNSILSVFIKARSEYLMPIRMDFKITDFRTIKYTRSEKNSTKLIAIGILDINSLYEMKFQSYNGTSFNVLKKIAEENNLGFATNIDNTNDKMTWINPAEYIGNFISKITNKSYKDDSAFLWSYIDFYYNLCFIDIETQLSEDITEQQQVLNYGDYLKGKEIITPLILSNHPDFNTTNMYIDKYSIINETTKTNLKLGYKQYIRWYDKIKSTYSTIVLDTISTKGAKDNQIILKGQPNSDYDMINSIVNSEYMGKIDTDNVHENYIYAQKQNSNNIDFLQKIRMTINLVHPNFNLNRFQKVNIELYELTDVFKKSKSTNNIYNVDKDKINQRLSGEWLITGINYKFSFNEGNVQEVTLVKRELTAKYN